MLDRGAMSLWGGRLGSIEGGGREDGGGGGYRFHSVIFHLSYFVNSFVLCNVCFLDVGVARLR